MKRNIINNICLFVVLVSIASCSKKTTDYRSFLGGTELVYPGVVSNFNYRPGNKRLMLVWNPSPDPSVTKYLIRWNNNIDSLAVNATSHKPSDTVKVIIDKLDEYPYSFFINSYDADGNKSVLGELDNARVYGSVYQSGLHNRMPDQATPYVVNDDGTIQLNFNVPDTINITTKISYTNAAGSPSQASIAPNINSVVLPSYQSGTAVTYQSSYVPVRNAIDTFTTLAADTFPSIFRLVQCDKSLFKKISYSGDMQPFQSSTDVEMLWNGSMTPQGWPDIYHNNGNGGLPGTVSFDMGKVYSNLAVIEEIGRSCCHNPIDFEVWGISDTTNAFPAIASSDPSWKSQTISKGWTLLTEAFRTDDGIAPMKFNFISNPPPVRYIRVRFIKSYDDPNYINLTQLTFWNKD